MANLGEVFVESHVDNKAVYPELKRGVEEAGQKVEKEDDFGGFVKAANKAGSRAGKEFGDGFIRDSEGRLRTLDGRFAKEGEKAGDAFGDGVEKKSKSRIQRLGKLLAPAWARTIAVWVAILTPAAANLLSVILPAVGVIGLIIPAALGAAASLVVLKLAFKDVGTAIKDIGTAKFNDDLKKLAPAARDFVKQIAKFKPAFHDFQQEIQQGFFSGLGIKVVGQLNKVLKGINVQVEAIAYNLGRIGAAFGDFITKSNVIKKLNTIFGNFNDVLFYGQSILSRIVDIILTIGATASQYLPGLAKNLAIALDKFDHFLNISAKNGNLKKFFDTSLAAFGQLWSIITSVYRVFSDLITAAGAAGGGGGIINLLKGIADVFDRLKDSGALVSLFETFNQVFSTLGQVIEPLIEPISQLVLAVGTSLRDALKNATPALVDLAKNGIAPLITSLVPFIPALTDFLVRVLVPALQFIADHPEIVKNLALAAVAIKAIAIATRLWAAAQAVLDVALDANPIGVFIITLVALGTLLYSIYVNTRKIIDAFLHPSERTPFFQDIIDTFNKIKTAIADFVTKTIPQVATTVKNFFTQTIPNAISTGLTALGNFFTQTLPNFFLVTLPNLLAQVPGLITTAIKNIFNAALIAVGIGIGLLVKAFVDFIPRLALWAQELTVDFTHWVIGWWNAAKEKTLEGIDALLSFLRQLPSRALTALVSLGPVLGNLFRQAFEAAKSKVEAGIANIITLIRGIPGKVTAFGGKIYDAGVTIIKKLLDGLAHPGGVINSVGDKVISALKSALNAVIRQVNKGINKVNSAIPFGSPVPTIPLLAKGALITKPTLAVIGEGGAPEVVLPTNDPKRAQQLLDESGLSAHLESPAPDVYVLVQIGDEVIEAKVDRKIASNNAAMAFAANVGTRAA